MVRALVARLDRDRWDECRSWAGRHLTTLAAHRTCLLLGLLACNALFLPYRSRYQDAILYEFQVANQEAGGRFAGDLFFEFGSQDRYSLFSKAMVPLARAVGRPAALWLFYLGANGLFYLGLVRLTEALIPDRLISSLAVIWLAVVQVPLGGLAIFHVNEPFTTPRLLANALVLLGLERMLAGKLLIATALLAAAMPIHPLMACGGVLIALTWAVLSHARQPRLLLGVGLAAGMVIVAVPALGIHVFGYMDPFWHRESKLSLACLFGTEWDAIDWLRVLAAWGVGVAAWRAGEINSSVRRLLGALVLVSALGLVGAIAVSVLPYALLAQGQPFRLLWINQVLAVPLAFALAREWWAQGGRMHLAGAILLVAVPGLGVDSPTAPAVVLPVCLATALGLSGATINRRASRRLGGFLAIVLGASSLGLTLASLVAIANLWGPLASLYDPRHMITIVAQSIDPITRLVIAAGMLVGLGEAIGYGLPCRLAFAGLAIGVQLVALLVSHPLIGRERLLVHEGDLQFLRAYITAHGEPSDRPPTLYWPTGRLEHVWHDLNCCSYFTHMQIVGNVFHRATAVEARRRAVLAAPFEAELTRSLSRTPPPDLLKVRDRFIGQTLDAAPTTEDVHRLCADPRLDYAVLHLGVPGWYAARHGSWFLYDCRALRASGVMAHSDAALAATARHLGERP